MSNLLSIWSTALILIFVIDPFGNIPVLLAVLKSVKKGRIYFIIAREVFAGLVLLLIFLFFGGNFLSIFHLETAAVTIAGGIIFLIIGIKLIFPDGKNLGIYPAEEEPFLVPIAIPMIAGPSALATLLVISESSQSGKLPVFFSLMIAWGISAVILFLSPFFYSFLKEKGLSALEKLMGMLLLMMSVQMLIDGLRTIAPTFT